MQFQFRNTGPLGLVTRVLLCVMLILTFQANWCHAQSVEATTDVGQVTTKVKPSEPDNSFLFNGQTPTTIDQLKFMETHFADIAQKVKAATVNIKMGEAQGTGVVVTSDGYILTAAHVIGRPNGIATITFVDPETNELKEVKAETLGVDTGIDSGMLKIKEEDGDEFPYLDIAISDEVKEGQWVMAVGHPGGIDEKRGMVVRVGRVILAINRVIKTDCTLVGGDSGGPLVDMNGDLIGIHSRIGAKLVDNLHVPTDVFTQNWDKLARGISLSGAPSFGLNVVLGTNEIETVTEDGPAEQAGIEVGDVLIEVGGLKVKDKQSIFDAIKTLDLRPNVVTNLVVERDGERKEFELTVGDKNRRATENKK